MRWDVGTGRRLGPPRQVSRAPVPALVGFTARGAELVTSSAAGDATVIRDVATLRPVRRLRGGGAPSALSPDGRVVAFGAADGSVDLLDLHTGILRVAADRHTGPVTDLRFAPDSRTLLTAGGDGRLIRVERRGCAADRDIHRTCRQCVAARDRAGRQNRVQRGRGRHGDRLGPIRQPAAGPAVQHASTRCHGPPRGRARQEPG